MLEISFDCIAPTVTGIYVSSQECGWFHTRHRRGLGAILCDGSMPTRPALRYPRSIIHMIYLKQARTPVAFALGCSEDNVIQYAEENAYCVVRIPPQRGREPHHGIIVQSTTFDTLCSGLSIETFRHLQDDMLLAYESDNWRRFGFILQRTIGRRLGIKGHSSIVFGARVQSVSFRTRAFVTICAATGFFFPVFTLARKAAAVSGG
jgi:hypothetical protein